MGSNIGNCRTWALVWLGCHKSLLAYPALVRFGNSTLRSPPKCSRSGVRGDYASLALRKRELSPEAKSFSARPSKHFSPANIIFFLALMLPVLLLLPLIPFITKCYLVILSPRAESWRGTEDWNHETRQLSHMSNYLSLFNQPWAELSPFGIRLYQSITIQCKKDKAETSGCRSRQVETAWLRSLYRLFDHCS